MAKWHIRTFWEGDSGNPHIDWPKWAGEMLNKRALEYGREEAERLGADESEIIGVRITTVKDEDGRMYAEIGEQRLACLVTPEGLEPMEPLPERLPDNLL